MKTYEKTPWPRFFIWLGTNCKVFEIELALVAKVGSLRQPDRQCVANEKTRLLLLLRTHPCETVSVQLKII